MAFGREQTLPHPPQWLVSERVSTQAPLHSVLGATHELPGTHCIMARLQMGVAPLQASPQRPQFICVPSSVSQSGPPPQFAKPGRHT
jgi:hypothetical protein